MPRIERLDSFWRPYACEQLFARDLVHIRWEQCAVEVGPEPRHEKHHLGGDEENHTVAVRDLDDARVISLVRRLAGNIAPPADHGIGDADHADTEDIRRRREHMVHPGNPAERRQERRDGADCGPRAGRDQMVVMVRLGVNVGHFCVPPSRGAQRPLQRLSQLRPPAEAAPRSARPGSAWRDGYIV